MHNKKKEVFWLIIFVLVLYFVSPLSAAQRLINFQGRLTDQQDNPLEGTYNIKFGIYSSDPNAGPLWTEEHTDVSVNNGIVNVLLGSISSFDEPVKITFDEERYLGITVDCDHDPNTKEPEMTSRQRIMPSIYSYDADKLDGKDSSEYTTPQTDAGRPGVAENLYEGNIRLIDKYATKNELDWNKLSNMPPDFADGVDHVNDSVSNPGGTYNSMTVGNADKVDGYHADQIIWCRNFSSKTVKLQGDRLDGGRSGKYHWVNLGVNFRMATANALWPNGGTDCSAAAVEKSSNSVKVWVVSAGIGENCDIAISYCW